VRLDEKPYPGEPITLLDVKHVQPVLYSSPAQVSLYLTCAEERRRVPAMIQLGYDFACPDWRERLGRAKERIEAAAKEHGHKGVIAGTWEEAGKETGRQFGLEDAVRILREEFGLEEDHA
jgi:hypothetical protein